MKKNSTAVAAVILAAGCGTRMNSCVTKQKMTLLGESILLRSARAFDKADSVSSIVVVCRGDEQEWATRELKGIKKLHGVIIGGKTRAESAKIGFEYASETAEVVAIHDAARCLVTTKIIDAVIAKAIECGAATAATAVSDTVKRVG